MKWCLVLCLLGCASCSLFSRLKKEEFGYGNADKGSKTILLQVPRRFNKKERVTDSAGNTEQVYYYDKGIVLYVAHVADSIKEYQSIDTENNIPAPHPAGGLIYKMVDTGGLYRREIRVDSFRFGYKNVPRSREARFDSALNYAGYLKPGK